MRSEVWVDGGVVVCQEKACCVCEPSAHATFSRFGNCLGPVPHTPFPFDKGVLVCASDFMAQSF